MHKVVLLAYSRINDGLAWVNCLEELVVCLTFARSTCEIEKKKLLFFLRGSPRGYFVVKESPRRKQRQSLTAKMPQHLPSIGSSISYYAVL